VAPTERPSSEWEACRRHLRADCADSGYVVNCIHNTVSSSRSRQNRGVAFQEFPLSALYGLTPNVTGEEMGFSLNPLKDISSVLHAGEKLAGKALHAGEKVAEDGAKGFAGAMKDAAKAVTQMSPSEIGHTVLNVAGMVPVIGAPADAINACWYAAQGDWKDAALSAATAIPGMGDFVGGARLGATALKIAEDGARIAEDGVKAERATKGSEATKGAEAATKSTEAATKGEVGASIAERVGKNQAAQDRLIENQQTQLKEAIERGVRRRREECSTRKGRRSKTSLVTLWSRSKVQR
jgi:hypothetical protein